MSKGFVTAADVAARAGVSRSAVSRTFTPGAYVSAQVRARVSDAAEQVGYRVNRLAQSLIQERSSLVGVVAANVDAPFNAALLSALSQTLPAAGWECLLFNATNAEAGIEPLIERILEYRARALVILSGTPPNAIVAESLRRGLRVILVNKPMRGIAVDTILSDDLTGARLAADRLIRAGARRLATVASGSGTPSQRRRIAAFRKRAAEHGLTPLVWAKGETRYETGGLAAAALLDQRPDGVFCVTDLLAMGFLDTVRHVHGLAVPDDLSLVGFDDIRSASWSAYRLTTIRQSVPALAQAVLDAVQREGVPARRVVVPVELIERGTVRQHGSSKTMTRQEAGHCKGENQWEQQQ
jgi:DNA-binding LacI/PurR family transcriptional regulator